MKFWWQNAKGKFEYDPQTFMWTVTIYEDKENSFSAGKCGKHAHFLFPWAYTQAVYKYYKS